MVPKENALADDVWGEVLGQDNSLPETDQVETDLNDEAPVETDDSMEETSEDTEEQAAQGTTETIEVMDSKGRKKKITLDYNDKDQIKKFVKLATGARKWQADKDRAIESLTQYKTEVEPVLGAWNKLNTLYAEHGVEGVVNQLLNDSDGFNKLVAERIEKARIREGASPEQLRVFELEDRLAQTEKQAQLHEQNAKKMLESSSKEREQADQSRLMGMISPAFDKYRLAGKHGDADFEQEFDEVLWQRSLDRLSQYGDDAEITPEIIEKEMRNVALKWRKAMKMGSENIAKKTSDKQKRVAQTHAALAAQKGNSNTRGEEMASAISGSNINKAFQAFLGKR